MAEDNDNLGGVLELIEMEVREPAEKEVLLAYIRDFLFDVRDKLFVFSEKSTTFSTIASQSDYPIGVDGVPGDILRVVRMRSLHGSTYNTIRQKTIAEIRDLQQANSPTSQYPQCFAFFERKIIFYPTPSAVTTIYVDYHMDATRDAVSGAPFNARGSSDSFTNEFFRSGRALMTSYVLMRWGMGRGRDLELAQAQGSVYNKTMSRMIQEYGKLKWGDGISVGHI